MVEVLGRQREISIEFAFKISVLLTEANDETRAWLDDMTLRGGHIPSSDDTQRYQAALDEKNRELDDHMNHLGETATESADYATHCRGTAIRQFGPFLVFACTAPEVPLARRFSLSIA